MSNGDSRNLVCEWLTDAAIVAGDWTEPVGTTALNVALSTLTNGANNTIALSGFNGSPGVNTTGFTKLRCGISGGQPAGVNEAQWATFDNTSGFQVPELQVTYTMKNATPTRTPSNTPTRTPTNTPSNTPTTTPSNTPTATPSSTPTDTPTNSPTATPSNTPTETPTNSPTPTPTSTTTDTPTNSPTRTPSNTPTNTPLGENGEPCMSGSQCLSMNCVDQVCCDTACTLPDHACNLPGREGTCLPITAAPAPALTGFGKFVGLAVLLLIAAAGLHRRRLRN